VVNRRHAWIRRLAGPIMVAMLAAGLALPGAAAGGPFVDDDTSVHEVDIEYIFNAGVTTGCASDRFCPEDTVTRGQMAAFLNRALGLSNTSTDFFDDDASSIFQGDINKLAASGITSGCATRQYCPDGNVTRGQMAAFLVRAYGLTAQNSVDFLDDNNSIFENDIEKLATAGITVGCNPPANDRFCPDDEVTRGQMASFLARAMRANGGGGGGGGGGAGETTPTTSVSNSGWNLATIDFRPGAGRSATSIKSVGGVPGIAYHYDNGNLVAYAICTNVQCSGTDGQDLAPGTSKEPSMAVISGTPVIAAYNTSGSLDVTRCTDADCATSTLEEVWTGSVGFPSVAVVGGNPAISFWHNGGIKLALCANTTCSSLVGGDIIDMSVVPNATGQRSSIAIVNGRPMVSYQDEASGDLMLAICSNATCSGAVTRRVLDSTTEAGAYSAIAAVGTRAVVAYYDTTNTDLKVALCNDTTCTGLTRERVDDSGSVGTDVSIAIAGDGFPWIAYRSATSQALKFVDCDDAGCSNARIETVDDDNDTGYSTSIAVINGDPYVSYYDLTARELRLAYNTSPES